MKNNGFSLIELMIVVAIVGILAAVAVPAFVNYANGSSAIYNKYQLEDGSVKECRRYENQGNGTSTLIDCKDGKKIFNMKIVKEL